MVTWRYTGEVGVTEGAHRRHHGADTCRMNIRQKKTRGTVNFINYYLGLWGA